MHIPLAVIPHHRPRPFAVLFVPLNIDAQAAIHLEPEQHLVIHGVPSARRGIALDALQVQLLQPRRQVRRLQRQALGLGLGVARRLGGAELVRVQARNRRRVVGRRVRRHQVVVLRCRGVELPRELLQRRLGVALAQLARLLQC